MKKLSLLALLAMSILASNLTGAEIVKITTSEWEPYIGESLPNKGFVAEIAKEAFKRGGYEMELTFYPWARAVYMAKNLEVDGYYPEFYAKELENDFYLSDPFKSGPVGLFKRKGFDFTFKGLESLKPYKIGVVRGYVNEEKFDKATIFRQSFVTFPQKSAV